MFLINPEYWIYFYFPLSIQWQLLARPVTEDEFSRFASVSPTFFEYGLSIESHPESIIHCSAGHLQLVFGLPVEHRLHFACDLFHNDHGELTWPDSYNGIELVRYSYLRQEDGKLNCTIDLPASGAYKLEILGRKVVQSFLDEGDYEFTTLCSYLINCDRASNSNITGIGGSKCLPRNQRHEWGDGVELADCAITPMIDDVTIYAFELKMEVEFASYKRFVIFYEITNAE